MAKFLLNNVYTPKGDQPNAIRQLTSGYRKFSEQTLLGVTGSGKTFTIANLIQNLQVPTLVLSPNKTLASQLHSELQNYFPKNRVCYFVSYYDYYQPESYIPQSDTYIEKDTQINDKIERLRHEAAASLITRKDVIVVASVSCIYGFGDPRNFENESFEVSRGQNTDRQKFLKRLVSIQYERNDIELRPGRFRVKGDTVDLVQGFGTTIMRFEFFGDEIDKITELHGTTGRKINELKDLVIFPARAFVTPESTKEKAMGTIRQELSQRLPELDLIEAHRLKQRTNYDLEMLEQLGFCKGVENYSRHFDFRKPGEPPYTLIDYFQHVSKDWLFVIDESHVAIPQVHGMYEGDRSRKKNLIDYGFRLPSAFDNRPLKFDEFKKYLKHVVYVSATPGEYEVKESGQVVEQIIRPTGLIDPEIEVRPIDGQVDDLLKEIRKTIKQGHRILITTLTKRMAEELSLYFSENSIKSEYLHSEIETLERTNIIRKLRLGKFDVLVGINLLREGLDLPEVALVAILDADKEGFLRNERSLIQTIGRAARNVDSKVIMYADVMTRSIKNAIRETKRRRVIQKSYNKKHNITPMSITKAVADEEVSIKPGDKGSMLKMEEQIIGLDQEMRMAAENLDFEVAIDIRDKIDQLKKKIDTITKTITKK